MTNLVVITGAGISIDSGIPPFRGSANAVWEENVTKIGTLDYFKHHPVESWQWYLDRFIKYMDKEPNEAHHRIAALHKNPLYDKVTVITQNVDVLHEKANTFNLIKIHGSMYHMRCSRHGCKYGGPKGLLAFNLEEFKAFIDKPCLENIPRCVSCKKLLRPHVLWFDESYADHESYQYYTAMEAVQKATDVWFIGTSFSVNFVLAAHFFALHSDANIVIVDPNSDPKFAGKHYNSTAIEYLRTVA